MLRTLWAHLGIMLEQFGNRFGIVLAQLWVSFGTVWDHFGILLGSVWDQFGINLVHVLGTFFPGGSSPPPPHSRRHKAGPTYQLCGTRRAPAPHFCRQMPGLRYCFAKSTKNLK